ncbi:hypothetical protein [Jhaorihella thermophila]|uniref:Outer membrane protein beta-barrel domain-containing protein n=2 Tax=Jhaorihella thermophila TaxID=488547 RepID=A0A1H5XH26_9RHOB|nr:hypothetical protein [Jhaorihella thermophila]SEG11019.1 hypothetical protein SAMN05421751_11125 [Jhaorihella thermophila]
MMRGILAAAVLAVAGAATHRAEAGTALGFGFTYVFDGDLTAGVRVFSDDKPDRVALSAGMDYKFATRALRPNVGAAYLKKNYYLDLGVGYDFGTSLMDFGVGAGATANMR